MKILVLILFFALLALTVKKRLSIFSAVFLAFCFLLAANPAVRKKASGIQPRLAVCLDTSRSMATADEHGSRIRAAKEIVRKNLRGLEKYFTVSFYGVSGAYRKVTEKEFFGLRADGDSSALRKGASGISGVLPQDGAVLFLTDGRDNASAGPGFLKPVYSVLLGRPRESDLSVEILSYPEKAFEKSSAGVELEVKREGSARSCSVTVGRGRKVLAEKKVRFSSDEHEKKIKLEFLPGPPGKRIKFFAAVSPRDAFPSNNRASFRMSVFKSQIKIMFISGRPGWEYRNLRALIKADPKMNLTSFVILRNPEDYVPFPDNKLSLIPFPVREIFLKDIGQYDLVILMNFDYRRFIPENYLKPLAQHLKAGGGLLLIGGENVFVNGNYFSGPLGDLLPIKARGKVQWSAEKFSIRADGSYPVTSLISSLPGVSDVEISGLELGVSAREGAETLLSTSSGVPVAVCGRAGAGRVETVLTNGLWRLFFGNRETGYFFQEFFRNSIAWLTGSPLLDEISVSGRESYMSGERLNLSVRVRDIEDGHLKVRHFYPRGSRSVVPVMQSPGIFSVTDELSVPGRHRAEIEFVRGGRVRARKTVSFRVSRESIESGNTSADPATLREMSESSGGKFFTAEDFGAERIAPKAAAYELRYPARSGLFLLLFVLSAAAVWLRENRK